MSRALINTPVGPHPGMPQPNGGGMQAEAPKLDVLEILKRKFAFILFFVLLGIALSLLFFFKVPKTYQSTAKIFVDEKNAPSVNSSDTDSNFESTVEKYMEVIKSTKILQPAIDEGEFDQLASFKNVDDILFQLREENIFEVVPADAKSASGVIRLAFRGATREECQRVLENIVTSFDGYIESTTKNLGGETTQLVERMQDQLSGRLKDVNEEIQRLMSRPELLNIDGRVVNPHQLQQTKMQEDLHDLMRERTRLAARVDNVRKAKELGQNQDALMVDILQEFNDSSLGAYVATNNRYVELKVEEQQMLNEFGEQHPDLIGIRRKIAMVNDMRMQELSSLRGGSRNAEDPQRDMIDVFLDLMDRKIEMIATEESSLRLSLKSEQAKSQALSVDVEKLLALQREREQLETGYLAIVDRLGEIKAYETHLWRNMTVLDPPSLGEQVAPSLPISLAGGLLMGCLAGFMFACFKEIAEKTFRSSDDISTILGARVIGHIQQFNKARGRKNGNFPDVAPEVIALHQPASQTSETYRGIRTTMFFKAQETNAKVIQVTSPTPGDGKSTTISNLAASIAQSGRRVLLIDADFRKPVQHKLFGLSNSIGMTSVLAGEVDLKEAIRKVESDCLSVMPCGPIPSNPAELLTSSRFTAIIGELRDQYDFVLIDSPPMLAVTDPSIICSHADLVYLVIRIRNGVRSNSLEAKEIIDSMGIELGGVVVNGLRRRDQKGYNYGAGQYGYGRYKYGKPVSINKANQRARETETV
jgi:capsular exopolysaccharide synthesis family protein